MHPDVAFSISQFQGAWRVFCRACPDRQLVAFEGLDMIFSGLPIGFFNVGIVTGDSVSRPQLEALCERACEWRIPIRDKLVHAHRLLSFT